MLGAFSRWVDRWRSREVKRAEVRTSGPGSADSDIRRHAFAAREARREASGLPRTAERMVGEWDATFFAPSAHARAVGGSVARLVEWGGEGFEPHGVATGFLVSPDLLLTNWHVIPERLYAQGLYANFGHERTERGTAAGTLFALEPHRFFLAHERLDFALIAVQPVGSGGARLETVAPIRMIEAPGKIQTGDPMHVIQHPSGGPRQYAVTNNRLVDILEADGFLHYESDTLQGSSGSPVFNRHWELVALHHCGVPAMRGTQVLQTDGTVWDPASDDESQVEWVANEGARVSVMVAALREVQAATAGEQRLLDQLLATVGDPYGAGRAPGAGERIVAAPSFAPHDAPSLPPLPTTRMSDTSFYISGGTVTIHVSTADVARSDAGLALAAQTQSLPVSQVSPLFVERAQNFDPDYTSRPGYDPDFLGVTIPLPTVIAHAEDVYTMADYRAFTNSTRNVPAIDDSVGLADDAPCVLHYHRYSLVHNRVRRMALFTASNVDYTPEAREDTRPRAAFGGESWRLDPRVPKDLQLVDADIYGPAQNLDRGHLVRREDNAWGTPGLDTEYANADSYHWTNCTPQHELFNQERPKGEEYAGLSGIWGTFEAQLQTALKNGGGQATLFAGPVLYTETRQADFGRGAVVYPLKFWKVVVVPNSTARTPTLAAYGFVFDQSRAIRQFGLGTEESLALPMFSRQSRPLTDIMELAGVEFPEIVLAADTFDT